MNTRAEIPGALRKPLAHSLLALRLGVFLVMLMWTLDQFVNPAHASRIFSNFYGVDWLSQNTSGILGGLEVVLILAFVAGLWRRWIYGAVLLLHAF